jgi:hypothetical protein
MLILQLTLLLLGHEALIAWSWEGSPPWESPIWLLAQAAILAGIAVGLWRTTRPTKLATWRDLARESVTNDPAVITLKRAA